MHDRTPKGRWVILTGEYPPQFGGVGDYSRLVAKALSDAGDEVQVWAPGLESGMKLASHSDPGITVNRLSDHFGRRGLAELDLAFETLPPSSKILVQYVPHAFGRKAMNLAFCLWLCRQGGRFPVTVMFHEVASPWVTKGKLVRHNLIALVNRLMVALLVRAASRLCVSIPSWEGKLRLYAGVRDVEWLPIPSTMPQRADPLRVRCLRHNILLGESNRLIGHFGTFKGHIAAALRVIIPEILALECRAVILLVGRGATEFAAELQSFNAAVKGRVLATGQLESNAVSEHLSACDLLIQPYSDGISSRRTSAMAGLACGVPIVTTCGFLTEPIWQASGAVRMVHSFQEMAFEAVALLRNGDELARLRSAGLKLYRESFHLDRTLAALRGTNVSTLKEINAEAARPPRAADRPHLGTQNE